MGNAAIDRDDEEVAALAVVVVGPMAEHQMVEGHGFHLRLGAFFVALFVAGVVGAFGIDRRDENDALAIGRPSATRSFCGNCCHFLGIAGEVAAGGVKILHIDLRAAAVAWRLEDHTLAVRRETRTILTGSRDWTQPFCLAAGHRHDPQVWRFGVRLKTHIDGTECHPPAIRGDRRLADTLELHHVFESEGMFGLGVSDEREGKKEQ